jgi:23S rRNA G2069 N7-methylase RlmK/C1962 C5-methylase RlmI
MTERNDPPSPGAPPFPGSLNDKAASQALMLENRLRKRYRHLSKWARRTGAGAFRLYDRDIPEIPLVLDYYQADGIRAAAGSAYQRPYEKDPEEEEQWLTMMEGAIERALEIPAASLFIRGRRRRRQKGGLGQENSGEGAQGVRLQIAEGGLKFRVNLSDYLDTGLFLDRRLLRSSIRAMAGARRVLNLFAYTCSFSVYAAAGGAALVDSVDLSNTYLNWGRENFALNGLGDRPEFRFIRADARSFLDAAARTRRRWDLIILDPPTFSNSKKMEGTLDIKRDQGPLLEQCLGLLDPGGTLVFSVNARGFKLEGETGNYAPADLTEKLRDEDFRGRRIPACYLFKSG